MARRGLISNWARYAISSRIPNIRLNSCWMRSALSAEMPGHLREPGRVVGDHLQRRRAEFIDDLIGRARPDVRQRTAGKEGIHCLQILRHIGLAFLGVELAAIGGVVLIFTAADHTLARMELAHDPAHHGHRAAAGNFKHRVAVVRVLVDNVLHRSLDLFQLHAFHPLVT